MELDDFEQITTKKADSRGRVTLGSEYAGERVKIVVVGVEGEESD